MKQTILIGSDHAGFELKNTLVEYVKTLGYEVQDMGAHKLKEDDDYPIVLHPLAKKISEHPDKFIGIVLGGSGQGEAIVCNRYENVRAAVYYGGKNEIITKLSRLHNNSNVLSLGARFITEEEAKEVVQLWLETGFPADERHSRRIRQIDEQKQ